MHFLEKYRFLEFFDSEKIIDEQAHISCLVYHFSRPPSPHPFDTLASLAFAYGLYVKK